MDEYKYELVAKLAEFSNKEAMYSLSKKLACPAHIYFAPANSLYYNKSGYAKEKNLRIVYAINESVDPWMVLDLMRKRNDMQKKKYEDSSFGLRYCFVEKILKYCDQI
jgi:hypothetical protein